MPDLTVRDSDGTVYKMPYLGPLKPSDTEIKTFIARQKQIQETNDRLNGKPIAPRPRIKTMEEIYQEKRAKKPLPQLMQETQAAQRRAQEKTKAFEALQRHRDAVLAFHAEPSDAEMYRNRAQDKNRPGFGRGEKGAVSGALSLAADYAVHRSAPRVATGAVSNIVGAPLRMAGQMGAQKLIGDKFQQAADRLSQIGKTPEEYALLQERLNRFEQENPVGAAAVDILTSFSTGKPARGWALIGTLLTAAGMSALEQYGQTGNVDKRQMILDAIGAGATGQNRRWMNAAEGRFGRFGERGINRFGEAITIGGRQVFPNEVSRPYPAGSEPGALKQYEGWGDATEPHLPAQGAARLPSPDKGGQTTGSTVAPASVPHPRNPQRASRGNKVYPEPGAAEGKPAALPPNQPTPQYVPVRSREELAKALQDPSGFNYDTNTAHNSATFWEALARSWAKRNGKEVADWYNRYSGGILNGGEDLARALLRLEGGDPADAANVAGATIPMRNWSKNPLDVRQVIAALSSPDKTTFVHETGHVFLRQLLDEAGYNPQVRQDIGVLASWAGVSLAGWTREHHEKFARAFERWRQNGQSPNAPMAGVFSRFKNWLTDVYSRLVQTAGGKSALERHPAFNPEVIDVLSRYVGDVNGPAKTGGRATAAPGVGPVPGTGRGWHGMGGVSEILPPRSGGGRLPFGMEPGGGPNGPPSLLAQQALADAILFQRRMGDPKKVEGLIYDIEPVKSYLHDQNLSFQDRASYLEEIGLSYATPTLWEARQRMVDAGLQSAIVQARPQADRFAPRDIFYYEGHKLPVGSLFWDGEAGGADGEARFPVLTAGGQPSQHSLQGGIHYIYGPGNNIAAIASNANLVTKFYKQALEAFYELQKKDINPERLPAIVYRVGRNYVSGNLETQVALQETMDALLRNKPNITQEQVDGWAKRAFKDVKDSNWGKSLFTRPIQAPETWADWQKLMPDLTYNIRTFITQRLLHPDVADGKLPTFPSMVNSTIDPRLVGVPNAYMAVGVVSVPRPVDPSTGEPIDLVKELSGLSKTGRDARLAKIAHDMMMVAGNDQRTKLDQTKYKFRREPNISAHTTYTHALPSYFEGFLPVTHHQDLILGPRASTMNDAQRKTSVFEELPDDWYDYQFGTGTRGHSRGSGGGNGPGGNTQAPVSPSNTGGGNPPPTGDSGARSGIEQLSPTELFALARSLTSDSKTLAPSTRRQQIEALITPPGLDRRTPTQRAIQEAQRLAEQQKLLRTKELHRRLRGRALGQQ